MKLKKVFGMNNEGQIVEEAFFSATMSSKDALVAHLEQTINKNFHTWDYNKSKFNNLVKETSNGFEYEDVSSKKVFWIKK